MSWSHTHRDGVWHRHADDVVCDADLPAKLRGRVEEQDEPDEAQEWFDSLEDFEPVCEAHERFDCKRCAGRGVENAVEDL